MNRIFRIVWSKALRTWVVASELVMRCGKGASVDKRVDATAVSVAELIAGGSWRPRLIALAVLMTLYAPVQAADRYWDSNTSGIGLGGDGTWNTTSSFWNTTGNDVAGPWTTWNNAALDNAIFGGTAGTVTLGAPITANKLTFNVHNYTITGGTLTLAGTTPTIDGAGNATINLVIAGTAGLTKAGAGILTLGGANTFTGGVNINAGILTAGSNAALGNTANVVNLANGARLDAAASLAGRTVNLTGAEGVVSGVGASAAHFTGTGGLAFLAGTRMTDDTNDFTGAAHFYVNGDAYFSSVRDEGQASSLGAGSGANGTIRFTASQSFADSLRYTGDGDTSNRNWQFDDAGTASSGVVFYNEGTGSLTLTGGMAGTGTRTTALHFHAATADMALLGTISSNNDRTFVFRGNGVNRTITLGGANTYSGATLIGYGGAVTVRAPTLADTGMNSSFGTGSAGSVSIMAGAALSYTGAGGSSNRAWTIGGASLGQAASGSILNDGTGALALSGAVTFDGAVNNNLTLGGSYAGATNTLSGVISGTGNLVSTGSAIWNLTGANTRTGSITVNGGTLRAGSASAFGTTTGITVNGGTLDLNGNSMTTATLAGSGGTVALGAANLTLNATSGSTTYAGSITGGGSLTKTGASTLTLTGQSTYTGATTVAGGTLALNFAGAGGPTSNIISGASTLNMSGSTVTVTGAAGEANVQNFNGLNVTSGSNRISTAPGSGGTVTVNLGGIVRSGGLIDFGTSASGIITTTNADGTLGGWATVNGSDYAKVQGGSIIAFTTADYVDKDEAATWLNNEFISDSDGDAVSFSGTVAGSKQLGGLQYTTAANSTVNVDAGQTLGIDGTIIVASTVNNTTKTIQGGSLTGLSGGGTLGVLQNGGATSNFTIASAIVDNTGAIGFSKGGTGLVTLTGANTYTGATTLSGGTLSVNTIANAGTASSIGAASNASSNLVIENGTLSYTGANASTDRGFTLVNGGPSRTIEVTNGTANLAFNGVVTSPDNAGFIKTGAGTLTLGNAGNNYVGTTTVSAGTLAVNTLGNGGAASTIGASSSASANLVLQSGGELEYTGATGATDRGFTLGTGGGAVDVTQGATTLTVGGAVVGAGALSKNGPGTLLLSGANTFTGGGGVNGGVLQAGSTSAFGTGGWTIASGATLDLNDFNNTVRELVGAGTVDLGSATLTLAGAGGFTFTGNITGTGGVTATGGGSQIFSGCGNTYTGATTINGSTVSTNCLANGGLASGIGASSAVSSNLTLANAGLLQYTGGNITIERGINLAGNWGYVDVSNVGTTLGFTGAVIGPGGLAKRGQGTLVLSGTNTYTTGTSVEAGTLLAGSSSAFGTGAMLLSNVAGAALDLNNFNNTVLNLSGGGAAGGNVSLGSATLTISNGSNATYSGVISGTGGLRKSGGPGAVQALAGCASSYTGSTVVESGGVWVTCLANGGSNSSMGASSADASNLVLNGGSFAYTGAATSTDRLFTLGATGTLAAGGSGPVSFTNTGAIAFLNPNTASVLTLAGVSTDNNSLAAQLTNNGTGTTSLTKSSTGTWILNNPNSTYTGVTTIAGGVLGVSKLSDGNVASSIGASSSAASNLVIGSGSTLRYTGAGDTTNRLFTLSTGSSIIESSGTGAIVFSNTGSAAYIGSGTRTLALGGTNTGANTMGGTIVDGPGGATTLAKNDSGNWVLTGNNTFTGNTVINNGNLTIGNGGTSGNAGAGNVFVDAATSTLSINRSDTFNFTGTISGAGNLAQIGTGTTVLTAAGNTIGGATSISAGTLQVNGGLTTTGIAMTGTSALTVNGTVQAAGGTASAITGGAGASTINVNTGGTLRANGDLGGGSDVVNVTGTLDTGTAALNLGDGNDTFALNDGAVITGTGVDGGLGTSDILQVNNALARTISGAQYVGFERLVKQNAGVLTATGTHTFSAGTDIAAGTLDVDGSVTTPAVTMADGTTLNVDGTVQAAGATAATLTGSAGTNTVLVNTGATLRANGDLGGGNDTLTLAGTLDTGAGTLALGSGDDTVTLNDGAALTGFGLDAGTQTNSDVLILNNALGLSFDGSRTAGFENLIKQNAGTATMTDAQTFSAGTAINGGVLDIDGSLATPTVTMTDGTALNVDGGLQGDGIGSAAQITGSDGVNTVTIAGIAIANGDLGAGNDVLDVSGTLDINGGVFALGDGDDSFVVHDGTNVIGTIDGGAGLDSRVYNINTTANLGAMLNFEGITKTGTGTLNLNGPGATDLQDVQVLGGTLNIAAGASVVATAGSALTTTVGSGATLNVDGSYGCGALADTMTVSGTVSGAGTVDLCDGDDRLTLNDGAVLNALVDGNAGTADTMVLNNAGAMAFNGGNTVNFEILQKNNVGEATLTGAATFTGGTQLNGGTLTLGDTLTTPTLMMGDGTTLNIGVAGTLQGDGVGAPTAVTGSAGTNTVVVSGIAAMTGDLGDGNDVLEVTGALDTGSGAFSLGAGDDLFRVHDVDGITTDTRLATINGGLGNDTLDVTVADAGNTVPLGSLLGFESLGKSGAGTLEIHGASDFIDVNLNGGTLRVTDTGSVAATNTTLLSGTTLELADGGTYSGTTGADTFTVAGTVISTGTNAGTIDLGDGSDTFTIQDGANLSGLATSVSGGAGIDTFVADLAGTATLGGAVDFEALTKTNTGTLIVAGAATSSFATVNVLGGTLDVGVNGSLNGVVTGTVASGSTLSMDGSYTGSTGNDSLTIAGTVTGSGSFAFDNGDDTLTLNDGADLSAFTGTLDGGAHSTGDRVVLNNATAMSFNAANVTNFEFLQKDNIGEATLTGNMTFSGGTAFNGGTLTVDGSLTTPTLAMADGTTLNVDGALQGTGGTAAAITGSAGVNTVTITGTALASGDLGAGNDVVDVTGTLDTDGGVFALGDGDDSFVVHDGSNIVGTIDGGAGLDSRVYDINTTADLGAMLNFEGITKTGTGVLNINGPGATDLQDVQVLGGTLNIGAAGSVVATAGSALNTIVGSGATLNVDGSFGCGALADTMTVGGTVSGIGTVNLCGGDDTLTLHDGAVLANVIDGDAGTADTVVLNNAGAMTFNGANTVNFEVLRKDNVGEATLTGAASFTGGTQLNGGTLTVDGSLTTPTLAMADGTALNVDGTLQGTGGTAAAITGSAGINTVTVAAGATLTATGDLGDGNDVLDAAGIIDTDGGTFSLGAGDDIFNVYDTTDTSLATIDGGAGNDLLDVNVGAGNTVPLGGLLGFESLGKSGAGTLEIGGASSFIDVNLNGGTLRVTDTGSVAATNTTILSGATLELADGGSYSGTAGDDAFTVAGTVVSTGTNAGTIDLGDGSDTFTIQDGANLSGLAQPVSGGAGIDTFVADLGGTATLGGAVNFETLNKTNTGTLIVAGPAASTFSTVNVAGGTLDIGAAGSLTGVQSATVASGATLNVDGVFGFTAGADSFTVAGIVTGTSAIDMLDGDDTFVIQDGANLSGLSAPVDGGAGTDTFTADLAGTATLGGAVNFETLNKTNTGTLIVAGPAASSFSTVNVAGGTLDIAAAGSISGVVTGTVANGATLNVDGNYAGSTGNDTLTVAGALTGNGSLAFDDGDDTLTLNDGADLSAFTGALDGGAHSTGDRVVLNNAGAMAFNAANLSNFEFLQKDNTGEATLTGTMDFSAGTLLNAGTLTVGGSLTTPTVAMGDGTTLNVDGSLQGTGGTAAAITGSSGLNTVTITGTAIAVGDLGAGNDVLDVVGTLDTNGGTFGLGDGDDDFVVHDGTTVTGTVDGGAGLDSRVYDIAGTAEFGALLNFEGVTKRGTGTLTISGPSATDLQSVEVEGGTLTIGAAGSVIATAGTTLTTVVGSGATLNVEGSFGCGTGNDTMTVAGTVAGTGTVGLCGGNDTLTLQDGATLANGIDGGADTDTVVLDTATAMSFNGANTTNFEVLQKDNLGEATLTGAANFSGGTRLNGGTLTVAGDLTTPTLAMSDGTTLNVTGTVQGSSATAITGSTGINTVNVTGSLLATGDLGAGNDVLDVTGTLDTGTGTLALGEGDDTLTIHDGTRLIGTVAAGAGNDTFNTNIATSADLGAVQGFETLSKTGAGTLNVNGPASSDFATVNVLAGTLNVASGGSIAAQTSTVASGATLQVAGTYSGTAGDDSFTSMGTVRGALSFGAGADTASFVGGDISGLTGLDGGAGTSDRLSFSALTLGDSNLTTVTGWERVELLNASALTLGTTFNLGSGVLAIDATSQLTANAGARITGHVENAGLINAGGTRLAISGHYTSNAGALRVLVSPGNATSGGLDIAGDVVGNTRVTFASDRSIAPEDGPTSIQVITSPNDNAATAGGFVPDSADGIVRVEGSVTPWTFGQQADHNWYLSTEADALLPEVAGYGVLSSLGTLLSQQGGDLVHQRLAGVRNNDPQCDSGARGGAGANLIGDCEGAWVAATASELTLGANPGFAVSGDDVGLYVGIDGDLERDTRSLRVGGYLGYTHGVYWASGANSTELQGMGPARVDLDTPVVGVYANTQWHNGHYLDVVLSGHRPNADIRTADGFTQHVTGNYLTVSARVGRSMRLDHGWTLEPQLQLTASQMHWQDTVDAAGRELMIDDDLVGTARAALRVEKAFTTAGGASIKPWVTLAIQNVVGEKETGMTLSTPGSTDPALAFPNHDLGISASVDVGLEAKLGDRVSVFGVLSIGQELEGSNVEQRSANVGVRARW